MADQVKTVTTTNAGEGNTRTESSEQQGGSNARETPGKVTTTETAPERVVTSESLPGKATTTSTETSPERRTTETRQPVGNRTVSEASETVQRQGEQKTVRTGLEDAGAQVTFTFRISDFL